MLAELKNIGFKHVGEWILTGQGISPLLTSEEESKNLMYSFIIDGKSKYIGKTTQTLKKRMYQYSNPGPTQTTNIRNNKNILNALSNNYKVEIYAFIDNGLLSLGIFKINISAGLEDNIIKELSARDVTCWNMQGVN